MESHAGDSTTVGRGREPVNREGRRVGPPPPVRVVQRRSSGRSAGAGAGAEVPGADFVQDLAELLDLVPLLVRDLDPDLVEQCPGAIDRGAGADGEGDG